MSHVMAGLRYETLRFRAKRNGSVQLLSAVRRGRTAFAGRVTMSRKPCKLCRLGTLREEE